MAQIYFKGLGVSTVLLPLLGGGENCAAYGARERDEDKKSRRVEIVLPGLIYNAELSVCSGVPIRQHRVDLAALQGDLIALVAQAESQLLSLGGHVSQDNA